MFSFLTRRALMIASAAAILAGPALAQGDYPSKPIRMIIPLGAGGPADTTGRIFAKHLGDALGQTIVVENISGASSVVGTQAAVDAQADGYTLLFGSSSAFAVNPAVIANLPFDIEKDLRFIALIAQTPHVLVVNSNVPAKSFEELVQLAKQKPGELSYGMTGHGGNIHMSTELFKSETGTELEPIPYSGGGAAAVAVVSGEVDVFVNDLGTTIEHINAGTIRPLAMFSPERSDMLPDVPTTAELGFPNIVSSSWFGLAAPAETPDEVVTKLQEAIAEVNASETYKADMAKLNLMPMVLDPAATADFIAKERQKWGTVADAAKVEVQL